MSSGHCDSQKMSNPGHINDSVKYNRHVSEIKDCTGISRTDIVTLPITYTRCQSLISQSINNADERRHEVHLSQHAILIPVLFKLPHSSPVPVSSVL